MYALQEGSEQRPHKVSYHIKLKQQQAHECIEQLSNELTAQGLSVKVIYSGGEDLDILPAKASKGKGLEFLLKEVTITNFLDFVSSKDWLWVLRF